MAAGWAGPWILVAESSAGAFAWNARWLTVESARALATRVLTHHNIAWTVYTYSVSVRDILLMVMTCKKTPIFCVLCCFNRDLYVSYDFIFFVYLRAKFNKKNLNIISVVKITIETN